VQLIIDFVTSKINPFLSYLLCLPLSPIFRSNDPAYSPKLETFFIAVSRCLQRVGRRRTTVSVNVILQQLQETGCNA
jgi:hypothetical protein